MGARHAVRSVRFDRLFLQISLLAISVVTVYHRRRAILRALRSARLGSGRLFEELERSRQSLDITLRSIGDGVIVTDSGGCVTFMNPTASNMIGMSEGRASGRHIEHVLPLVSELTGETIDHPIRKALREKRPALLTERVALRRADGSLIPIDDSATPIVGADGTARGAVMVVRDATDSRRTERSLLKWEHLFRYAGFGIAIYSAGLEPQLRQANPAFCSMHGFEPGELKDFALSALSASWHKEQRALLDAETADHLVTESVHRRRDGTTFPVLIDATIVRDYTGQILYGAACYSDITERADAEEQLRKNEEHFRTLADSLPHLVWTATPDGKADYFNSRWYEEHGHNPGESGEESWHSVLHPDDRGYVLEQWNKALADGNTFQVECRLGRPDRYRWHICRAIPVRGSDGKITRWFGSCTDIDETRQVANALRVSTEQLQRTNLDLEQFAYAASHDLQEPLRMVVIYAQLLRDEFGPILKGKGETYLKFAVDGALRMEALIKGLLAYSRAAGPAEPSTDSIHADQALTAAVANLRIQIEQSRASINRGWLPRVRIPEVHLTLVFQNLLSNAIKYRHPTRDPVVSIKADRGRGEWLFCVEDNGMGIDPEYRKQIFLVFRRLHGADVPGTGIGLALCQRLIERHGGKIWVESNTAPADVTGSTFCFTLPDREETS